MCFFIYNTAFYSDFIRMLFGVKPLITEDNPNNIRIKPIKNRKKIRF